MARKMRDSGVEWIGEVPEGWEVNLIGTFYSQRSEKVSDRDYAPLSVTMKGVLPQLSTVAKTDDGDNRKLVKKGDFAINSRSDRRGSCGISEYDGSVSLINTILMPRGEMDPRYYNWLFHTEAFADEFYKWGHGIVDDLWTTRWSEMKRIQIVAPPLPEQRRIADYLDEKCAAIDGAVGELKRGIEDCKAWKKAIIFEAVTGKANVLAASACAKATADKKSAKVAKRQMRDSGIPWIGEIPEGWEVKPIKHLTSILPGYAFESGDFKNEGIRLLRGINVGVGALRWDEVVYWEGKVPKEIDDYRLNKGDLIVGLDRPWIADGTRVAFVDEYDLPCLLVQRVCRMRARSSEVEPRIVFYWLSSEMFQEAIGCETTGISVPHISTKQIEEFRMVLPPLPEQQAIANYLDEKCAAIDALVAEKEKLIADLEVYKKSLIFELVTGKREVA